MIIVDEIEDRYSDINGRYYWISLIGDIGVIYDTETENLYSYIKDNDYIIRGNNTEEVSTRSVLISK